VNILFTDLYVPKQFSFSQKFLMVHFKKQVMLVYRILLLKRFYDELSWCGFLGRGFDTKLKYKLVNDYLVKC